ncbi:MAG: hypothetical protein AB8B54_12380 [Sphingorhabdus sp.]
MAPNIWKNVAAREVAQVAGKTQSEADAIELWKHRAALADFSWDDM